jgi:hypothetical protein
VRIRFIRNLTSLILTLVVLGACAAPEGDAARLAADSCAADPFTPVSATNQFAAGPVEVFFADPTRGDWFSRARQRAQLSARAAAQDAYWQPLADSWGIAEARARARASTAPEAAASAGDLKLSYAMVTKDAYCRIALVRIGTRLSASQ